MRKTISIISAIVLGATMLFTSCASSNKALDINGKWNVVSLDGTEVVAEIAQPSFEFIDGKTYHVETGINIINGDFNVKDDVLTLGEGMMTRMAGSPEAMELEDKIVAIIANPIKVAVDGDVLTLTGENGAKMSLKKN